MVFVLHKKAPSLSRHWISCHLGKVPQSIFDWTIVEGKLGQRSYWSFLVWWKLLPTAFRNRNRSFEDADADDLPKCKDVHPGALMSIWLPYPMARCFPHHSAFAHAPPLDNSVKSTWECFLCAVGHSKVRGSHEKFCILLNVHFLCHLCFLCCKCLDWGLVISHVWRVPAPCGQSHHQ